MNNATLSVRKKARHYETGPEITSLLISQAPALITAIAALIKAWRVSSKSKENRTVMLTLGKHVYEGPVKDEADLKRIVSVPKAVK